MASPNCFRLLMHAIRRTVFLALVKAGDSRAARRLMIAITTKSSTRVKAVNRSAPARLRNERDRQSRFSRFMGWSSFAFVLESQFRAILDLDITPLRLVHDAESALLDQLHQRFPARHGEFRMTGH